MLESVIKVLNWEAVINFKVYELVIINLGLIAFVIAMKMQLKADEE